MSKLTDVDNAQEPAIKVTDRRHWAIDDDDDEDQPVSTQPTILGEYQARAEAAEQKLHEYIAAFKQSQDEQEAFRTRLQRDVERKVELSFAELVSDLVASLDDLDLAIEQSRDVAAAAPVVEGVALARDRFLAALGRHGVERISLDGEPFDPRLAEALRVDPVEDPAQNDRVTETLRAGYRLGEVIVRAAQVAVGKHGS